MLNFWMFLPFSEGRSECNGVSLRSDFCVDVTMAQKSPNSHSSSFGWRVKVASGLISLMSACCCCLGTQLTGPLWCVHILRCSTTHPKGFQIISCVGLYFHLIDCDTVKVPIRKQRAKHKISLCVWKISDENISRMINTYSLWVTTFVSVSSELNHLNKASSKHTSTAFGQRYLGMLFCSVAVSLVALKGLYFRQQCFSNFIFCRERRQAYFMLHHCYSNSRKK